MYKTLTAERFLWKDIDLDNKTILEAGTSWGNTTDYIASKVEQVKANTKLMSVDIDDSHFKEIEDRLAGKFEELILRKADLSDLSFIKDKSVDIVVCNYTLASVNQFPMRANKALMEFYRILKPGGDLLILEEMPIWSIDTQNYSYWSKRLRIIKSISVLKSMSQFNEIHPEDLDNTLNLIGFKDIVWDEFNEKIDSKLASKFLDKRKKTLIKGSNDLINEDLSNGFTNLSEKLIDEFKNNKEFLAPAYYLKAKR